MNVVANGTFDFSESLCIMEIARILNARAASTIYWTPALFDYLCARDPPVADH